MLLRELTRNELKALFDSRVYQDFHKEEIKPFDTTCALIDRGIYQCLGAFAGQELAAYAFVCRAGEGKVVLLDYYAVSGDMRGRGIGSTVISMLKERFRGLDGMVCEVEAVRASRSEEDRRVRERRIAFYERNGMHLAPLECTLFGVEYSIMSLPCGRELDGTELYHELDQIYRAMFPAELYCHKVNLRTIDEPPLVE